MRCLLSQAGLPTPEPPELPLLRLLLSSRWRAESLPEAERLIAQDGCDWDALLSLAQREGLAPLLWSIVRGRSFVPPHIEQVLADAYRENAIRNTVLWAELERVVTALEGAGIPVILLKGAALAETVYGDIALRPMADLDLLVRPEHAKQAILVLQGMGYASAGLEPRPGFALRHLKEMHFGRTSLVPFTFDLHWDLVGPAFYRQRLSIDWFWQGTRPTRVGAVETRSLSPGAQLLHLAVHLQVGHKGEGIRFWLDLVETVLSAASDLDWDELVSQADAQGLSFPLHQALAVLAAEWRLPIAPTVLAHLSARAVGHREQSFYWTWRSDRLDHVGRFMAIAAGMSFRRALDFLLAYLFPSPTYIRDRYAKPELSPWQLYPYHWLQYLRRPAGARN